MGGIELLPAGREIKSVDRHLPFGLDQRDLDVAVLAGELGADAVKKSRLILRDHLDQGAVRGAVVVNFDLRLHLYLRRGVLLGPHPVAEHAVEVGLVHHARRGCSS